MYKEGCCCLRCAVKRVAGFRLTGGNASSVVVASLCLSRSFEPVDPRWLGCGMGLGGKGVDRFRTLV